MKTLAISASAAIASIAMTGTVLAADLGGSIKDTPAPYYPPAVSAFTWTGFYLGLQTGYVWGNAAHTFSDGSLGGSSDPDGWIGGGHLGYNWQSGNFVLGVEGDIEGGNVEGSFANAAGTTFGSAELNWQGSIRGRIGIAADRTLFYVTAGWAFAEADVFGRSPAIPFGCCSTSADLDGWTLGGGIEYAFSNNFTIRGEYRYTDFGNVTADLNPTISMPVDVETHALRVGASWKF